MQELVQQNKQAALTHNVQSCLKNSQMQNFYLTLPALSTLKESHFGKFWDGQCEEIQSKLWLPLLTDSQDLDSTLFVSSSNCVEDKSRFWMKRTIPNSSLTLPNLLVSLPASATATTVNDLQIAASKKIRFYPQNEKAYDDFLTLYRRAYNLAVEYFKNGKYKDEQGKSRDIRPEICEICKEEQAKNVKPFDVNLIQEAVRKAGETFAKVCKNNKGKTTKPNSIHFKSRKGERHSFTISRLPKGLNPYVRSLGKITLTESVPDEAIMAGAVITKDKGRWFLQVKRFITIQPEIQGQVRCVGIDPGVRSFATGFSATEAFVVGEDFAKDVLAGLMLKVDKLLSKRQLLMNKLIDKDNKPQWFEDQLRHIEKQLWKLKNKKDDLILDMHNRLSYYLVSNYDVIFLPSFESKKMVKRQGKTRTIRRNTARQILDLNHYSFKLILKWYAKKYGKIVVDVDESYTSKTRSWDGTIDEKLGSSKIIKTDKFSVGRDINGARNILIKHLKAA